MAAITGPIATRRVMAGAGTKRGYVHGQSDKTASAPLEDRVHPGELLATIYHAFGIDPAHDRFQSPQPARELVQAEPITRFFA